MAGDFPQGRIVTREATFMWFEDVPDKQKLSDAEPSKKKLKHDKSILKAALIESSINPDERKTLYDKFNEKKSVRLIYILCDVDKKDGFTEAFSLWNDELFNSLPTAPRIVLGYSTTGNPVISNNEAIDLCFELAVMEYMEILEPDPNTFVNIYTPSLDRGRRATGMSRYLMVESSRDKRLAKRKPRLYDRLDKQTVDDALGTLPVAMIQWAGENVGNLVGIGDEDKATADTTQTCAQFVEAAGSRFAGVDNRLQFLICGNRLTDFDPNVMAPGFWKTIKMFACSINSLEHLNLGGKSLDMSSLVELYASHNFIKSIDLSICNLKNLKLLDLSANELEKLPVELFELSALELLDLGSNKIQSIPSEIGALSNLKKLFLDNNRLETLPFNLFLLEKLDTLELHSNQLRKLPSTIASLKSLKVLTLQDNSNLKDIPKPVLLGGIDVLRNFLEETSQRGEYCFRTKLMIVGQENVGKTNLLRSLVKGATNKEKAQAPASSSKANDGMVGTASVRGRTTTSTRRQNTITSQDIMSKDMFQTSGKTLSTDGIDIYNIHIETEMQIEDGVNGRHEERKHLTFSVWDFAGQEIYYTTHSFFLTDRSLFVIVFNLLLGPENCRVEYWLNSVKARTPTAPIFLVGTHLDKVNKNDALATMEKLEKKFKKVFKIRGSAAVSCESLENVDTLIDQLLAVAKKEPYMGAKLPASYFALEDVCAMERRNKELLGVPPILSWNEVVLLAKKSEFMPNFDHSKNDADGFFDANLSTAVDVLHLLGAVVRFKDAGCGLENFVILDPQWVTKIFATIITTKQNFIREGVVEVSNLFTQLWRNFPPKLHPMLLQLLESFEIVFKLPDDLELAKRRDQLRQKQQAFMEPDETVAEYTQSRALRSRDRNLQISPLTVSLAINGKDRILVPALLPEARPDFVLIWPDTDPDPKRIQYTRHYEFPFMPNGLFSRFMIRLLKFSDSQRYWRNGVLVRSRREEDDQALIELSPVTNLIAISVRGANPAEFFRTIIELLDSLLVNWFKISANIHAVCPLCIKNKVANPTRFTKEECLESSAHGSWFMQCQAEAENDHLVKMEQIAPDIAMSDFEGKRIDLEREVELGKVLGQGAYGKVYLGKYNKEEVAIKTLGTEGKSEDEAKDIYNEFRKEVWIMSGLQHPCIVNLKGFSLSPMAMVLELIPHGELYKFLNKEPHTDIGWPMRLKIAHDIARGLAFLHSTEPPLLHRDIKSPNILMASLNPMDPVCAKVADFGLTGHVYAGNMAAQKARDRDVANPVWLAPEIMREEAYATAADVYPYGIILWELYAQAHPFDEFKYEFMSDLEKAIKDGIRPTIPEHTPPEWAQFIKACWDSNPQARPSFKSILEEWLPPLIDKFAPEIWPAINNLESMEKEAIAVKRLASAEQDEQDSKPWFKATYLATVDTEPTDRIVDMVQTEDEVWCISDRGALSVYNVESAKRIERFPNAVAVPNDAGSKYIVSLRYDFLSKRLIAMTKSALISFNPGDRNSISPLWVKFEGSLNQADGIRKKKKKAKWLSIEEGLLTIYQAKGDSLPQNELLLAKCVITPNPGYGVFTIRYNDAMEYYFCMDEDKDSWFERIELLIDVAKNSLTRMPADIIYKAPNGVDLLALELVGDSLWGVGSNRSVFHWTWNHNNLNTQAISFSAECNVTSLSTLAKLQLVRVAKTLWLSYDNDIVRVNVEKHKILEVLHGHSATIASMIVVGNEVWSYAVDNVIRVWDQRTAKTIGTIKFHHFINAMTAVGPEVLIAQESGLSVWNRARREKSRDLERRHEDPVSQLLIVQKDATTVWSLSNVAIHVWK